MKVGPRAKLLLIFSIFLLPIAASVITYRFFRPQPTANHGELLLPPARATAQAFERAGGGSFAFSSLDGRWAMVMADSGACGAACVEKLIMMRQVRLALGRDAERVARVYIVDDRRAPEPRLLEPFQGTEAVLAPPGVALAPLASGDRHHVYLVDPHGNVMMRWPAPSDGKGMLLDLQQLLKASQIG